MADDMETKDHAAAGHVSHDEADAILHRFNASHWGSAGEHARYSIPADPRRDDDIRLAAYIAAARKTEADRDALAAEVERLQQLREAAEALEATFKSSPDLSGLTRAIGGVRNALEALRRG